MRPDDSGRAPRPRLADLPPLRRLAAGLFVAGLFAFYAAAQVQLFVAVGGTASYPTPAQVLHRYHGDHGKPTLLHRVLDPALPLDDPKRMYAFLGDSEEECRANRARVLAWAEQGAPEEGWAGVRDVFTAERRCILCHSTEPDAEGRPRQKADLPLTTYGEVVAAARVDRGLPWGQLATTTHNHLFGFLVGAFLVSWLFGATGWRGPLAALLVLGAFVGALVDVAAWWLTKVHGEPWHLVVMGGGAAFGLCLSAMGFLVLDELWLRGFVGRLLARPLSALRLARRDD